jgi:phage tail-like protein
MPVFGNPRSFAHKHAFRIEVDGFTTAAAFASCSELSVETAKVEYWEGGRLIPHKSPGRLTFADVTLERGVTRDRAFHDWATAVADAASGLGLPTPLFKRNLDIVQLDRDGSTLRRWSLYNAFPTKWVAGAWDASSDDVAIESMTLTYDYFELAE